MESAIPKTATPTPPAVTPAPTDVEKPTIKEPTVPTVAEVGTDTVSTAGVKPGAKEEDADKMPDSKKAAEAH